MGHYGVFTGVGIFASFGVRKLVSDHQGAFGNSYKRALLASKVTLVLGSASVALGQDSTRNVTIRGFARVSHLSRIINSMMLPEYII